MSSQFFCIYSTTKGKSTKRHDYVCFSRLFSQYLSDDEYCGITRITVYVVPNGLKDKKNHTLILSEEQLYTFVKAIEKLIGIQISVKKRNKTMRISEDGYYSNFNIRISEPVYAISFNLKDIIEKYGKKTPVITKIICTLTRYLFEAPYSDYLKTAFDVYEANLDKPYSLLDYLIGVHFLDPKSYTNHSLVSNIYAIDNLPELKTENLIEAKNPKENYMQHFLSSIKKMPIKSAQEIRDLIREIN